MSDALTAKCSCAHCDVHLEFAVESDGTEIDCPQCGKKTLLSIAGPDDQSPTQAQPALSAADLVSSFTGRTPRQAVSPLYLAGLCLVAGAMVLLPLIYLGLIGLAGWLTYEWATHAKAILPNHSVGGLYGYLAILSLYIAPLFAGVVLVIFMIKPLFARRAPHAQPLALNPGAEPLVFCFVSQICEAVGAPFPTRIDVDCQLNASAGFRRGLGSFLGSDMVLTLGVPLIAGLNLQQLAVVVAHELGHFSQGFGMRLSYLIRRIHGWFLRVVYQRDACDLILAEWANTNSFFLGVIVATAGLAVWISRQLLKLIMLVSHGLSCFLMRQQEHDADGYAIQLAGSEAFESHTFRLHLLGCALQNGYREMENTWKRHRALPIDFAAYLLTFNESMPPEVRKQVEDTLGLAAAGAFDTHPSPGDRIRHARLAAADGVFHLDKPASALFSNFEALSRQVSLLHFSDDLRLPVKLAKFYALGDAATEHREEVPPPREPPSSSGTRLRISRNPQITSQ